MNEKINALVVALLLNRKKNIGKPKKKRFSVPNSEVKFLIDEWCCDEFIRGILKRRFCDNIKQEKLAEEFDMSVRRIQSILQEEGGWVLKHIPME